MGDTITRKCACCKSEIEIETGNIRGVVFYNKLYYHTACFEEMARKKATSRRGKPEMWQEALDNVWVLEGETKRMLENYIVRDKLNTWILEHYDIVMIPSYFWQLVADLEKGKYRNKRCKPISLPKLYGCWKWGQKNLDQISTGNKMNHRGPENDTDRLRYDLAILVSKYPQYLKYMANMSVIESTASFEEKQPKINYDAISQNNTTTEADDNNIMDLMNEIF